MSLTILTTLIILTSPWFILVTFEKITPAKFYIPTVSELLNNFFSYLSFDFLFFSGDPILKNNISEIGAFHLWELPFFLIGFYLVFSNIKKNRLVIIPLISFSVLTPFFKPSPNIFSSIPLLFVLSIIIAIGINFGHKEFFKKKNPIRLILLFIGLIFIFYNLFFFWHQYKVHYHKRLENYL